MTRPQAKRLDHRPTEYVLGVIVAVALGALFAALIILGDLIGQGLAQWR